MKSKHGLLNQILVTIATLVVYITIVPTAQAFDFIQSPRHIIIPQIALSLPVTTSKLSYNTWEVSPTQASFGEFTALPGTTGNTVIFAHARAGLFQDLPQLVPGNIIQVFTDYDSFSYVVNEVLTVSPENVDIILSSHNHELTLFTCTGVGDSHRFVVKASLIPVIGI